ncbi:MAG: DUF11 domain-containing protein [Clostridia bacterium]|nr:DUF11 domain-containing protein [Clostridia bacterium]
MATFTNQATLTYNNTSVLSNVTSGQLTETLSVTKTAANETYTQGERMTYAVSIVNTGTAAADGITVADDLGAFPFGDQTLYPLTWVQGSLRLFVNGVPEEAPAVQSEQPLQMTGLSVPANGNVLLMYEAEINGFAPLEPGSAIKNTVTLSGAGEPLTASATVTATAEPVLSIEKSLDPLTVPEKGQVHYTITLYNNGGAEAGAEGNPVVTDTFDPPLSDITVTYNGQAWSEGADYTYTGGTFTTSDGAVTVPAASFERDSQTGSVTVTPGQTVIVISGNIT